jgi:hypothetical protein
MYSLHVRYLQGIKLVFTIIDYTGGADIQYNIDAHCTYLYRVGKDLCL